MIVTSNTIITQLKAHWWTKQQYSYYTLISPHHVMPMNKTLYAHVASFTSHTQVTVTFLCMFIPLKSSNKVWIKIMNTVWVPPLFLAQTFTLKMNFKIINYILFMCIGACFSKDGFSSHSLLPFPYFRFNSLVFVFRLRTSVLSTCLSLRHV